MTDKTSKSEIKELSDADLDMVAGGNAGSNPQLENPEATSRGGGKHNCAPVNSIAVSSFSKTG